MNEWKRFDLNRTIHDYDFTMNALSSMQRFMDTPEFEAMDTDAIFRYIANEMSIVPFSDFLKRYIYDRVKIRTPFSEAPNTVYHEIIDHAFADNNAPFSFSGARTKKSQMINRWLTQKSVKREAVFVLGFGLKMKTEDVSIFLTKVLGEEDFDFDDPQETIIWYCLQRNLPYAKYKELMEWYQTNSRNQGQINEENQAQRQETAESGADPKIWQSMSDSPELFLTTEKNLHTYLEMLRVKKPEDTKRERAHQEYATLYDRCREIIAEVRNREEKDLLDEQNHIGVNKNKVSAGDITPGDVEKELCIGIPYDRSGNLVPITRSYFASLFQNKKMSRQRITTILNRERKVERFDLITLLFFVYAERAEQEKPEKPSERISKFVAEINEILQRCGMAEIYPVIPYEAFVLMCLVTECPMDVYAEVWEQSYAV